MTTAEVATATLKALALRRPMALPGDTKMLPLLLRIAPNTTNRIVGNM